MKDNLIDGEDFTGEKSQNFSFFLAHEENKINQCKILSLFTYVQAA